jgi:protein-tyrosine phosphatase
MTAHPYDILELENGSQLIFTPCPGIKDASLDDSIATLKSAGASMLLTLMSDEEMIKNNAELLPQACEQQNINWIQLPIPDDAAPSLAFESQWQVNQSSILDVLNNKGSIAVHCKGGSGRTGLVIGIILLAYGWSGEKVIKAVQELRPKALKHPVQLEYFNSYL